MDIKKWAHASVAIVGIIGVLPIYTSIYFVARLVTLPLPRSVFCKFDEFYYREYQEYISLFFEGYSRVKVISLC